tara:strand:+ start:299 stop:442 length:144 start_codon:yes stop_codon:yes gene_type:complete
MNISTKKEYLYLYRERVIGMPLFVWGVKKITNSPSLNYVPETPGRTP